MAKAREHDVRRDVRLELFDARLRPWTSVFYPLKQGRSPARRPSSTSSPTTPSVNTVEINNTTSPPAVRVAESWAKRTPPRFEFSLKLFQGFTHKRKVTQKDVDVFKRGSTRSRMPISGALLCQFQQLKRDEASVNT
jgi:uncharacterized protein YecE (DUF72 family)